MTKTLSIDEIIKERNISPELLAQAERDTEELIHAYELKQARKAAHLTQKQVADAMGVSQKRISELENGDIGVLKLDTLRRYIEGIGGKLEVRAHFALEDIELA